jgi:hypothetical protein
MSKDLLQMMLAVVFGAIAWLAGCYVNRLPRDSGRRIVLPKLIAWFFGGKSSSDVYGPVFPIQVWGVACILTSVGMYSFEVDFDTKVVVLLIVVFGGALVSSALSKLFTKEK